MLDELRDTTAADHITNEEIPSLNTSYLDKGYK